MSYGAPVHLAYSKSPDRPAMRIRRQVLHKHTYLIATIALILIFFLFHQGTSSSPTGLATGAKTRGFKPSSQKLSAAADSPCRHLPGADDVLVVMKTGSTEIRDKLPIHFNTTLRCYPHYMLFSDYEEEFMGHHIYDALEFVSPQVKEKNGDFELWRRLQNGGRAALEPRELSGPVSKPQATNGGKPSNPGWKLDKWKFLPMVNMTYHAYPDKKWYMFVETDTYIMWQSVLNYMKALDETKPYYVGGQTWIGDVQFNHGGTGFIVSNPALKGVVTFFQDHQTEWEAFTDSHWAGDCVLGKAMKDSGAPPLGAWPIWQGDDIGRIPWWREDGDDKRLWCAPAVSYHHVAPDVIQSLWEFEQEYIDNVKDPASFLRHKDVYAEYVTPRVTNNNSRIDWDNHADDDRGPVDSLDECRKICEADQKCLQYSLTVELRCSLASKPFYGEWSRGVESGWIPERMQRWANENRPCTGNNWIT